MEATMTVYNFADLYFLTICIQRFPGSKFSCSFKKWVMGHETPILYRKNSGKKWKKVPVVAWTPDGAISDFRLKISGGQLKIEATGDVIQVPEQLTMH